MCSVDNFRNLNNILMFDMVSILSQLRPRWTAAAVAFTDCLCDASKQAVYAVSKMRSRRINGKTCKIRSRTKTRPLKKKKFIDDNVSTKTFRLSVFSPSLVVSRRKDRDGANATVTDTVASRYSDSYADTHDFSVLIYLVVDHRKIAF